jgi:hypothetical protein
MREQESEGRGREYTPDVRPELLEEVIGRYLETDIGHEEHRQRLHSHQQRPTPPGSPPFKLTVLYCVPVNPKSSLNPKISAFDTFTLRTNHQPGALPFRTLKLTDPRRRGGRGCISSARRGDQSSSSTSSHRSWSAAAARGIPSYCAQSLSFHQRHALSHRAEHTFLNILHHRYAFLQSRVCEEVSKDRNEMPTRKGGKAEIRKERTATYKTSMCE